MMKKTAALLLALILTFSFAACSKEGDLGDQTKKDESGVVEYNTVVAFDFRDFEEKNEKGSIKTGFVNVEESACLDKATAKKLAQNELEADFTYNTIKIFYDRTQGMWRVRFSLGEEAGQIVNVCIEDTGVTKLIVKE